MAVKRKKTKKLRVKKQGSTPAGTVVARRVIALLLIVAFIGGIGFLVVKGSQAVGLFLFSGNPQFAIHEIVISSDGALSPALLQSQADLKYGDNLFAVNPKQIERELKLSPKIQAVSVQRHLPQRLVIDVNERFPVARVSFKARNRDPLVISSDSMVMVPKGSVERLPMIYGVAGFDDPRYLRPDKKLDAAALKCALDVVDICNTSEWGRMIHIASIDASGVDQFSVYLQDTTQVLLPYTRKTVMEGKLRRLAVLLQTASENGDTIQRLDLTCDGINVPVLLR